MDGRFLFDFFVLGGGRLPLRGYVLASKSRAGARLFAAVRIRRYPLVFIVRPAWLCGDGEAARKRRSAKNKDAARIGTSDSGARGRSAQAQVRDATALYICR